MANTSNILLPDLPETQEHGLNQSQSSAFQSGTAQRRLPEANPRNAPGKEREIAERVNAHVTTLSEAETNPEPLLQENRNLKDSLRRSENAVYKLQSKLEESETHKNYWKKVKEDAEKKAQTAQESLENSKKSLTKDVLRLQRMLSNSEHKAKDLADKISRLEAQIERQKTEKAQSEARTLEQQTAENAGLRNAGLKLLNFLNDLKTAQNVSGREICQASNQSAVAGNEQLNSINEKLRMEMNSMKAKLGTIENQTRESTERERHLNRLLTEATASEAALKKEIAQLKTSLESTESKFTELEARHSTLETEAQAAQDSLLNSIIELTEENLRLQRLLSDAEHNAKEFGDEISTLEAQIELQKSQEAQAESRIAALERQLAEKSDLETENLKLREATENAQSKITSYEGRFSAMTLQKSRTEASMRTLEAEIRRLSDINSRSEENFLELSQKNAGLKQENLKLQDLFRNSDDIRIGFEKLATEAMAKTKELQIENDRMKIEIWELSLEKSKYDAKFREMEKVKSEADKKIRELTDLKAKADGNLAEFEEKQAMFFAIMKKTEKKMADADKNRSLVTALRSELEDARAKEVLWEEAKKTFYSLEALLEEIWARMRLSKVEESKFLELRKQMWDNFSVEEEDIWPSTSSTKIRRETSGTPEPCSSTSNQVSIVNDEGWLWQEALSLFSDPMADMETDEFSRSDVLEEIGQLIFRIVFL
ncbi:hypothetical protein DdX_17978 [Ditylenchus destructor]|uniref:Uncharacterized protein n=1 Tax=Ditylenchus destructor TaxID=166010 RepID=A0AAD4QYJ3_9BILA|nr:hypothetical protein DdX_17978 [Ditylenchus destructor]